MNNTLLVTGATGFVGGHLTRELLRRGERVRALGRNRLALDALEQMGAEAVAGDLTDAHAVDDACRNVRTVYHVGALSAPWGKRGDFVSANVGGTRHVLEACIKQNVQRIVYVSSPSVCFDGSDCVNQTESAPYPVRFVSIYSETKAAGERLVQARRNDLETVIVRPKAVFGENDTALLPRLVRAAEQNRLPIIGTGDNRVDLTYVANVVHAVLLAGESPNAIGNTYTITNGDAGLNAPCLWDVIRNVLRTLDVPEPRRRVPLSIALAVAGSLEAAAELTQREPFLTQYTASILARTQTYDISAARRDLGYAPLVPLAVGLERTIAVLARERGGNR